MQRVRNARNHPHRRRPMRRRTPIRGPSESTLERIAESHRYENECCSASMKAKHAESVSSLLASKAGSQLEQAMLAVNRSHFLYNTGVQLKSDYYSDDPETAQENDGHVCFGAVRELDSLLNYTRILEMLQLQPGHSFLHLGSGTGYLNTVAGCIIGVTGVNHGVEMNEEMLAYAEERQEAFKDHCPFMQDFEYCEPVFALGDCLKLSLETRYYDRIYCSGVMAEGFDFFLRIYLKPNGLLIFPKSTNAFSKVTLGAYNRFITEEETILNELKVYPLDFKTQKSGSLTQLPEKSFPSLQELTRAAIRVCLRSNLQAVAVDVSNDDQDPPEEAGPSNGQRQLVRRYNLPNFSEELERYRLRFPNMMVRTRRRRGENDNGRDSEDSLDEDDIDVIHRFHHQQTLFTLRFNQIFEGMVQPPIVDEEINETMVAHAILMRSICRKCHMFKNDSEVRQPSPLFPDSPDQPNSLNSLISKLPLPKPVQLYLKYKNSAVIHQ